METTTDFGKALSLFSASPDESDMWFKRDRLAADRPAYSGSPHAGGHGGDGELAR